MRIQVQKFLLIRGYGNITTLDPGAFTPVESLGDGSERLSNRLAHGGIRPSDDLRPDHQHDEKHRRAHRRREPVDR